MSSNSGRSGSTTKSRAPVMSTVRWPSARCSRTRRMPAGNDLVRIRSLNISAASASSWSTRRVLVAAVEVAQEVAAVARSRASSRAPRRSVLSDEADPVVAAAGGGWPATSTTSTTLEAMSVFSRSKAARWRSGSSTWRRSRSCAVLAVRPPGVGAHPGVLDDRRQVDRRGRSGPSRSTRGSKPNVGLVVGVERRPSRASRRSTP